jgi:hypothetical protein
MPYRYFARTNSKDDNIRTPVAILVFWGLELTHTPDSGLGKCDKLFIYQ